MRPDRYLPTPSGLLSALGPLAFGAVVYAQNNGGGNNGGNNNGGNDDNAGGNDNTADDKPAASSDNSNDKPPPSSADPAPPPKSSAPPPAPPPKSSDDGGDKKTSAPPPAAPPSSTDEPSISNTGDPVTSNTDTGQPTITGGSDVTSDAGLSGFPTLTRNPAIPTYPAPTVPPTKNAPFMQHSDAPSGTVFIAVAAILGAFGLALLLWRGITSLLLHRSVERAAMAQHDANNKTGFPAPPAPFYKYTDHASTMSLAAGAGKSTRRTNRGPIPSSNPSQSNLFFSPTAAASNNGGNRGSAFLPSGFYAAGSGSPAPAHGHSISLTNLRPDSRGRYGNASHNTLNPSPPDSPSFQARRDLSATSLSLNRPPSQRAPSAYLDDLLADDPAAFPPPQMPPASGIRHPSNHSGASSPAPRF